MKNVVQALTLLLISGNCGSPVDPTALRFPYEWLDTQGYGGTIDRTGDIIEPSGITFHPGRRTLFVVSDEGEVIELDRTGKLIARQGIPGDLEGITVNPATGLLYVIVEAEDIILEIDPASLAVLRRFPIRRAYGGDDNFLQKQVETFDNGCEAIVFIPEPSHAEGGYFFVSNQWDPPCVMKVEAPLRSGPPGVDSEATIIAVLPFRIDDPAALFFDSKSGLLNVVSDADNILLEVSLEGEVVRAYAFLGDNQEGLTRDDEGYLYIAQDSGGILRVKDLR